MVLFSIAAGLSLEMKTGGKETGVDDYAFALAGAILEASKDNDIDWLNSLVR